MNVSLSVHHQLSLISPKMNQADEFYKLIDKNRDFLNQHITFADNKKTLDSVKSFLRELYSFNIGGQKFNLVIQYQGQIIGLIGFHKIDRMHARAEVGYWLGEDYQGLGIMQQAIPKFLHYGFEALAINKVELLTLTNHERNIRLIEKLNFVKEGVLKEHYFMHDSFHDAVVYRMLKSAFLKNTKGV